MEDLKEPKIAAWMKAQADHKCATLDAIPGRAALLRRMTELIPSTQAMVDELRIVDGYHSRRACQRAHSSPISTCVTA
jgi:hypothetical protein